MGVYYSKFVGIVASVISISGIVSFFVPFVALSDSFPSFIVATHLFFTIVLSGCSDSACFLTLCCLHCNGIICCEP